MNGALHVLTRLVILITTISLTASAQKQLLIYSRSAENVTMEQTERFNWHTPVRESTPLNGPWDIIDAANGNKAGQVTVPCSWDDGGHYILERRVEHTFAANTTYRLKIGPTRGKLIVRLNGVELYSGLRNNLPLEIPLSWNLLQNNETILQVEIGQEPWRHSHLPGFLATAAPRMEAGIFHSIYIEQAPQIHLDTPQLRSSSDGENMSVRGAVSVVGDVVDSLDYGITVIFQDDGGRALGQTNRYPVSGIKPVVLEGVPTGLTKWTPESPARLIAEIQLDSSGTVKDVIRTAISTSESAWDSDGFKLNGQSRPLRGINYVYQQKEGYSLLDYALIRQDLESIRDRGYSAVRVGFNPMPDAFYQICDELGLICFQDLPFVYLNGADEAADGIPQQWTEYVDYLHELSLRYNSIAATGIGYMLNPKSNPQTEWLERVARLFAQVHLPLYTYSALGHQSLPEGVDFQLVEILDRASKEDINRNLDSLSTLPAAVPVMSSNPMSFRQERIRLINNHIQVSDVAEALAERSATFTSSFIAHHHDYMLQLPALSGGIDQNFVANTAAIFNLERDVRIETNEGNLVLSGSRAVVSEERASHSYIYIIVGILNLFVFMITYRRYRLFRQNLGYSIRKPHGFFVNLQERIIIPYRQSFFLLLAIALNSAIVFSSLGYFYRDHLVLDYLLSLMVYTWDLKFEMIQLIWSQPKFLLFMTITIIVAFYSLALILKTVSLFSRQNVLFGQALAATIWAGSPFVLLLPVGIFMYNMLLNTDSIWIFLSILAYWHLWFYLRWINGARVLLDWLHLRTFLLITILLMALSTGLVYAYDYYYDANEHFQMIYELARHAL